MDAISEAVNLLRRRRDEAAETVAALTKEMRQIDAALASLAEAGPGSGTVVHGTFGSGKTATAAAVALAPNKPTMKQRVLSVLLSKAEPWEMDALVETIREAGGQEDRADEQFRGTIRTALWTLRKEGLVQRVGQKMNIATEYASLAGDDTLPDDPEDSTGPAESAGPVVGVTTAGEGSGPHAQDHHHDPIAERDDRDDHRGAPVGIS